MRQFRNTNYFVTETGEVYFNNKKIAVDIGITGYARVWIGTLKKKFFVHRIVAEVYLQNPSNLPIVNHKDWNKLNNSVTNLEWCDYKYNSQYNFKHPTLMNKLKGRRLINATGELNKNTKLTTTQVEYIRKNYKFRDPENNTVNLAKIFNVSQTAIWYALKARNWKYLNQG